MKERVIERGHVRGPERVSAGVSEHATDVVVVGGGPSGLAAALSVARAGASVVLCEPQGTVFDKPCGEGVLPRGVAVLERLGVALETRERAPFRGLEYWIGGRRRLALPLDSEAWGVDRPTLLGALDRALAMHGVRRWPARVVAESDGRAFVVHDRSGARLRAEVVIEATGARGRASAAREDPARGRASAGRVGVRARARALRPLDHVEIHLAAEAEIYLTPLARGRSNVAVLSRASADGPRGARAVYAAALARHPSVERLLGPLETEPESRALFPHGFVAAPRAGWFPCGDHAVTIDPILGAGVGAALESGEAAGLAALEVLAGADALAVARAHARWVARATSRARLVAGALLFLSEHASLAGSVAGALAHAPALSRACVRFALAAPRARAAVLPR
ncbi:MAG: FAD-dependent monooxygenase [Planctomycetes bacterium]|nr:FAD-dependent monooxygenase [Planctomycetota bacterium]